ncbi:MAG: glycosyltransferase family 4 protein, partial [Thermoplasmata archaeon]|nr:glycosyltransferase family 4 protein [Thermoplasmata archaeon]
MLNVILASTGMVSIPPIVGGAIESYVSDVATILSRDPQIHVTLVSNVRDGWTAANPAVAVLPSRSPLDRYPFQVSSGIGAHLLGGSLVWNSLRKHVDDHSADAGQVVHINEEVSGLLLSEMGPSIPTVITMHNPPSDLTGTVYSSFERLLRWVDGRMYRRILSRGKAHLIVQTNFLRNFVTDRWGVDTDRITVLPPPLDTDLFCPPASSEPRKGLLFVGRLDVRKNVLTLLKVLRELPHDVPLTIVGRGPLLSEVGRSIEAGGLRSRIKKHVVTPLHSRNACFLMCGLVVVCFLFSLIRKKRLSALAAKCGSGDLGMVGAV